MFESFDTNNIDDIIETSREILLDYEDIGFETSITKANNYIYFKIHDITNEININKDNIDILERLVFYLKSNLEFKTNSITNDLAISYLSKGREYGSTFNRFIHSIKNSIGKINKVEFKFKNKLKS